MIKIIVDCFGGDKGVSATVGGAKLALETLDDLEVVFTGDEKTIMDEMKRIGLDEPNIGVGLSRSLNRSLCLTLVQEL